jgi:hypothetical protein
MGRARIVAPPPQDYIPEPLVTPPPEIVEEQSWVDGNMEEETVEVETIEPSQEEREKGRIAQEKYEELQRNKAEEESKVSLELQMLREENEKLTREKERAEQAREEQILKVRQMATDQGGSQLNIVQARKPSLISRIKDFFRKRRIELATVPRANYEQAIINQASVVVPKMLDEIEKMHENLTILEELLTQYNERQKIKKNEKHPHH